MCNNDIMCTYCSALYIIIRLMNGRHLVLKLQYLLQILSPTSIVSHSMENSHSHCVGLLKSSTGVSWNFIFTHRDSSDWLHMCHTMQYRWGDIKLEKKWEGAAATPTRATAQIISYRVPLECSHICSSGTALDESYLVRRNLQVYQY